MKYHYQVISSFDPTDIPLDSSKLNQLPCDTYKEADALGEESLIALGLDKDQYYSRVIPIAENIIEEDELDGHCYPGHEMWNDSPTTLKEYNLQMDFNDSLLND